MIKKALRTAAVLAALTILVGLTPVASEAAPDRSDSATAATTRPAPDGLWGSLADLWQGMVSAIFGGSEDEDEDEENGASGSPPSNAENGDPDDETDTGPGQDPTG